MFNCNWSCRDRSAACCWGGPGVCLILTLWVLIPRVGAGFYTQAFLFRSSTVFPSLEDKRCMYLRLLGQIKRSHSSHSEKLCHEGWASQQAPPAGHPTCSEEVHRTHAGSHGKVWEANELAFTVPRYKDSLTSYHVKQHRFLILPTEAMSGYPHLGTNKMSMVKSRL